MAEDSRFLYPNYLFEISWEICNKVGGIHTVLSTKALTVQKRFQDKYILIGPDVSKEVVNPEFEEDAALFKEWRQDIYQQKGLRVRMGRWNVKGHPLVMLVDFSPLFHYKDDILKDLWENYKVDSISGEWDYIEPVLFGYASGKVISDFMKFHCMGAERVVAHFHEWMTCSGALYLHTNAPMIATVFTTHATVMGRCIASNGLPLYRDLAKFDADELARHFNIVAKHSIEKRSSWNVDCFTTVSDITARECTYLLGNDPGLVTPNGFENDFVWQGAIYDQKQQEGRDLLIRVAELCLGRTYTTDPMLVGMGGRYEFKNKGIDLFLDALLALADRDDLPREVLAYLMIPAANLGPRKDLQQCLRGEVGAKIDPAVFVNSTHYLADPEQDLILRRISGSRLQDPKSKVQLIFVPSYLNGDDGIFDKHYYELLVGLDLTSFPSYYEPWGYTPLESVAFSVPTLTTSLAGFGLWVDQYQQEVSHPGVEVILRTDDNDSEVVAQLADSLQRYTGLPAQEYKDTRTSAVAISKIALWENLIDYYYEAYDRALGAVLRRTRRAGFEAVAPQEQASFVRQQLMTGPPNWMRVMVEREIPPTLRALEELSKNLWWSWARGAEGLFRYIDSDLWHRCGHNAIVFLDELSFIRLKELEQDSGFLAKLNRIYGEFKNYMDQKTVAAPPRVAYFSMEYGIHNSLKIFSGGLGVLAGDYLKEASDLNVPMVGVGLLYRYGYFTQRLSASGDQEVTYEAQNFHKLPISPVRDQYGNWKTVQLALPGRIVTARIWRCDVGRTELYLLDTDHEMNLTEDRSITYYLYGGDWENRLKQELLLGIGGMRLLREMGLTADLYHCNEGHAAFAGVERLRILMEQRKLSFGEALEVVRASSLFTTHTPVPAGHDAFPESMLRQYISHYPDKLDITWEQFMNLGKTHPNDPSERFSMSYLACNLSQEVNGVSRMHESVSRRIFNPMWPSYFPDELHIGYVTNGVHFPTWTASRMKDVYDVIADGSFKDYQLNKAYWKRIYDVDNSVLWSARLHLKEKLVTEIKRRVGDVKQFRFDSPRQMIQIRESLRPDVLTIGFARRFATYKRATLLFLNMDRLARIVNHSDRPVQFIFAGKAHPNDKPGQDLIKRIMEVAAMPQFVGKIIFLQNYDMALAKRMVQGVDVWLNTPIRSQEASGTSGEKAVLNGVLHFSVMDGWWVEGYKPGAGWMLPLERTFDDQRFQDEMDAEMIYNTIEEQIVPLYYTRDANNIPYEWLHAVKTSIADIASNFTTRRMLTDYQERFYRLLYTRTQAMQQDDYALAREMAAWKRKVSRSWDKVKVLEVRQFDIGRSAIKTGQKYQIQVTVDVDGLSAADVGVELVVAMQLSDNTMQIKSCQEFQVSSEENTKVVYLLETQMDDTGTFDTAIRLYARNPKLPHRMDFALAKWV